MQVDTSLGNPGVSGPLTPIQAKLIAFSPKEEELNDLLKGFPEIIRRPGGKAFQAGFA
jgi:hypothetical protein